MATQPFSIDTSNATKVGGTRGPATTAALLDLLHRQLSGAIVISIKASARRSKIAA